MKPSRQNDQQASPTREDRKRHGIYYTPAPVARFMVWSTMKSLAANGHSLEKLTIVDPACGEGAFLWQAYQFLCEYVGAATPSARLDLIRRQLFGVDLDLRAIDLLRFRFREDLEDLLVVQRTAPRFDETTPSSPAPMQFDALITPGNPTFGDSSASSPSVSQLEFAARLDEVLNSNFLVGNAVTGSGWEGVTGNQPRASDLNGSEQDFNWGEAFPAVKLAGGFDVVFANPPYRRERGAKRDLARMDATVLGNTRHAARMDLWHYFFHRSLDLLQSGGTFSLIVNSAWTMSQAGRPLVSRMECETTPLEFVLLERSPIFDDVDGRHLILRLKKEISTRDCRIWILNESHFSQVREPPLWEDLLEQDLTDLNSTGQSNEPPRPTSLDLVPFLCDRGKNDGEGDCSTAFRGFHLRREHLFQSGRLWLHPRRMAEQCDLETSHLTDQFDVRQGIAENPPRIIRKHLELDPRWRVGQGVFLLSDEERNALALSEFEQRTLRPYWEAAVIDRYWLPARPSGWLLYLTRETAPNLDELPQIARHLSPFRPLLERRREAQLGKLAWWHLHWPREPQLFTSPKVFAVQMGRHPRFVYAPEPAFVGFSVNLIRDKLERSTTESREVSASLSLPALTAILNSRFAGNWFEHHAKRRGVHLDITGGTLKRFPLPPESSGLAKRIDFLANLRMRREGQFRTTNGPEIGREITALEREIDELIDEWYSTQHPLRR